MLYSFVLEVIIFLGIGVIILILARALPRIENEVVVSSPRPRKNKILLFFKNIPLDKIDDYLNLALHKMLRKLKIAIMRADNLITHKLKSTRSDSSKKNGTGLPT